MLFIRLLTTVVFLSRVKLCCAPVNGWLRPSSLYFVLRESIDRLTDLPFVRFPVCLDNRLEDSKDHEDEIVIKSKIYFAR